MLHLVQVIDQSLGYVAPSPLTSSHSHSHSHSHEPSSPPSQHHTHAHQAPSTLSSHPAFSQLYSSQTVQEKWVDHASEYAEWERGRWKEEGDEAVRRANEESRKQAGGTKDWRNLKGEEEGEGMEVGEG